MVDSTPHVVVIAGPNGAGKSTAAPELLPSLFGVRDFVNADVIARGLSAFNSERAAVSAGRVMLRRLDELSAARRSFAFETTLSSRSFAPWLADLRRSAGYLVHLVYLWLPSPDLAVARVAARVRAGGHHIPDADVRRRYARGLSNLLHRYRPIADTWAAYATGGEPVPVASGSTSGTIVVHDAAVWAAMNRSDSHDGAGPD